MEDVPKNGRILFVDVQELKSELKECLNLVKLENFDIIAIMNPWKLDDEDSNDYAKCLGEDYLCFQSYYSTEKSQIVLFVKVGVGKVERKRLPRREASMVLEIKIGSQKIILAAVTSTTSSLITIPSVKIFLEQAFSYFCYSYPVLIMVVDKHEEHVRETAQGLSTFEQLRAPTQDPDLLLFGNAKWIIQMNPSVSTVQIGQVIGTILNFSSP